ncbi:Aldolase-type TIM barrel [Penicillium concentricum]|uniref:Aldolase-type TIM barrel n=1 Tax=Penicillium concentricum TaxID=293559 RepID=A0A9W9V8Z9_9EURO|nr:Aldolase-type TIM barrel [Penicillium concentricum]KAJ5373328.1 Aldolase-type TIM barrel [Penicillium concentricum]
MLKVENLVTCDRQKTNESFVLASKEIGPFQDARGNQFEIQAEIVKPNRSALLKRSLALATTIHPQFATITLEELAVEVVGIELALEMIQTVHGDVHVMVNPSYSYNTEAIVANAQRKIIHFMFYVEKRDVGIRYTGFHLICQIIDPNFDTSRPVTKVPATWEGMQAARQLKRSRIKSLATSLFSIEQAVLAGEAGCISISPFVHELKTETYKGYKDNNPILGICVQAQQFYHQNSMPTRLKSCVTLNLDELIMLAGIDALTITPKVLKNLAAIERSQQEVESMSLFGKTAKIAEPVSYPSCIDSESEYRVHFAASEGGKVQFKTAQAIALFCDAQTAVELYIKSQLEDSSYTPINL